MNEKERLQQHLTLIRTCAGWTASDLGDLLELSRQTISALEKGEYPLSKIQYLAIRKVLDDDLKLSEENSGMLMQMLEMLVDHPENYTEEERDVVIENAKLMAPSIMKKPSERKALSTAWKMLLAASGVAASAAFIAFLKRKD